jgi:hypothetical protein
MIEKYESRRIRSEIRQVLLTVWDPIGVGNEPQCVDEYDCCLGGVFQLLIENRDDDQIAEYLWKQANEHIGITCSKEAMKPTVVALRKIRLPPVPPT